MIAGWKAVWEAHKGRLKPNRKSGRELVRYLADKYPLRDLEDPAAARVVVDNVMINEHLAQKIPTGEAPSPVVFVVEKTGAGKLLYDSPDAFLDDKEIFVGIELVSGWHMVEGCPLLWDDLCAFKGLDAQDIENFFCVAMYIEAIKKFGLYKQVLPEWGEQPKK